MAAAIIPIILCGGSGSRLWPRSRAAKPKPFIPLIGSDTLFQQTLSRIKNSDFESPIIVTGNAHLKLVDEQLRGVKNEVIVEPMQKHTAAAVALAAQGIPADSVMLVCPSDHHITDQAAFGEGIAAATKLALKGWIVCLGTPAMAADTGFGYVRRGKRLGALGFRVAQFVEKPAQSAADAFTTSGEYAWNVGIFAVRAGDYLAELQAHRPNLAATVREAAAAGHKAGNQFYPDASIFSKIEAESLDCAVMENCSRAALVMTDMGWTDVGNWGAVRALREKDAAGNAVRGPAQLIDCRNVLVDTDGPKVHVIGLDNVVVVVDGNDIFVSSDCKVREAAKFRTIEN